MNGSIVRDISARSFHTCLSADNLGWRGHLKTTPDGRWVP